MTVSLYRPSVENVPSQLSFSNVELCIACEVSEMEDKMNRDNFYMCSTYQEKSTETAKRFHTSSTIPHWAYPLEVRDNTEHVVWRQQCTLRIHQPPRSIWNSNSQGHFAGIPNLPGHSLYARIAVAIVKSGGITMLPLAVFLMEFAADGLLFTSISSGDPADSASRVLSGAAFPATLALRGSRLANCD